MRKYFVLTSAGKPVYASDPDDAALGTTVGVIQTLISIFIDASSADKLRTIQRGKTQITFLLRQPLYYACASTDQEPESVARIHLEYLHLAVLSSVPEQQLTRIFRDRTNFDLGRLLEGTDAFFKTLLASLRTDFSFLTYSLTPLRMAPALRRTAGRCLAPCSANPDLLYALLLAPGQLEPLTLLRPRKHSIHPSDLHLLLTLIRSSPALREPGGEAWVPLSLPRRGGEWVWVYVSFVEGAEAGRAAVGFIGVGKEKDGFGEMQACKTRLLKEFAETACLAQLAKAVNDHPYAVADLGIAGLQHFLYKSCTSVQLTQPVWSAPYADEESQLRLLGHYQRAHDALHGRSAPGAEPLTLLVLRTSEETILGWFTQAFELYLSLAPSVSRNRAVGVANAVARWIGKEEASLWLKDTPVF